VNEQTFVDRSELDWKRLAELCDRAEFASTSLDGDEFREFVRLYRLASRDLSIARTRSNNIQLIDFLNDLVGRAYGILYRRPRKEWWRSLGDLAAEAAEVVRRRRAYVFASMALFFGAAFGAFLLMDWVPATRDYFVPPGMEDAFASWKTGQFDERTAGEAGYMTGFYASNNPRAAVFTGALGVGTFGFLSIILLATNGALLGTLAHELAPLGHVDHLLISILPHGVPELTGIFFAGAAGLVFGGALFNPGQRTRGDALRAVGRDGLFLLATSIICMFIAAPIEGFFSFDARFSQNVKLAVGLFELVAWVAFWMFYGRDREARKTAADSSLAG